jgi:hypothetical protein
MQHSCHCAKVAGIGDMSMAQPMTWMHPLVADDPRDQKVPGERTSLEHRISFDQESAEGIT